MNNSKENLPQNVKPRGFWGRIAVRVMAKGLRTTYKNVATVLDLKRLSHNYPTTTDSTSLYHKNI